MIACGSADAFVCSVSETDYGSLTRVTSIVVLLRHIVEACNEAGSMAEYGGRTFW